MLVAFEGLPGAGKTTTARLAARLAGARSGVEPTAKHPFIADFYSDPERYAFETELGFVLLHSHHFRALDRNGLLFIDYSPAKDVVFARMTLVHRTQQLALFGSVYAELFRGVALPDIVLFLEVEPTVCLARIAARKRLYESGLKLGYLERLRTFYDEAMEELGCHVIRLPVSAGDTTTTVARRALGLLDG